MSKRSTLPCATWYEAIRCWTDAGECNNDYPVEERLGVFRTRGEAVQAGKRAGLNKFLTQAEYQQFQGRSGPDGCFIKEHLVVFLTRSRTRGTLLKWKNIALTTPRSRK